MNRRKFFSVFSGAVSAVAVGLGLRTSKPAIPMVDIRHRGMPEFAAISPILQDYNDLRNAMMMQVSQNLGIPANMLSGKEIELTYSSSKLDHQQWRDYMRRSELEFDEST